MIKNKTLFISDLHLDESHPLGTEKFLTFLSKLDKQVDAVYILGDLFEAWVGDDNNSPFNQQIIKALRTVTAKNIPIYILYGNRDFLLGRRFFHQTGCKLLADETSIDLYGKKILLMHGDTLCTRDVKYLQARRKMRNKFLQFLFLLLPLKLRVKMATALRNKSTQYTNQTEKDVMDATPAAIAQVMQKHNVQFLIHGHTHQPAIHTFFINAKPAERIVLDAWHDHGNMLQWQADGTKELINF